MLDHRAELTRRRLLQGSAAVAAATLTSHGALAQARSETLLVVQELGPNSLDMQGVGSNQTVNGLSWNCYDRLMTYGSKTLADGTISYDRMKLEPELAESWEVAADGMSCTFKLRKDALFHDGTPVRSADCIASVKRWASRDPFGQLITGITEEWKVVDDRNFELRLNRPFPALLEALGHTTCVARDGPDGLRLALEARPDLVLLDIGLPGMSGYEVARAIRRQVSAIVRSIGAPSAVLNRYLSSQIWREMGAIPSWAGSGSRSMAVSITCVLLLASS